MSDVLANAQIEPLNLLNEELENYFQHTSIPHLFVDEGFILKRSTSPAMKQFMLSGDDIGKNIRDVSKTIQYPALLEDIQEVTRTGKVLEKEIQTLDLRWFQLNILPYVSCDEKKSPGVIITFADITHRILNLEELEKLRVDHENSIYEISHDLKQPLSVLSLMGESLQYAFERNDLHDFTAGISMLNKSINIMKVKIDELTDLIRTNPKQDLHI